MIRHKIFTRGIVAAFPKCGKTTMFQNRLNYGLNNLPFYDGVDSIENIIKIQNKYGNDFLVVVPATEKMLWELKSNGLKYDLVFPDMSIKEKYVDPNDIEMSKYFDSLVELCEKDQTVGRKYRIFENQYISDVLL